MYPISLVKWHFFLYLWVFLQCSDFLTVYMISARVFSIKCKCHRHDHVRCQMPVLILSAYCSLILVIVLAQLLLMFTNVWEKRSLILLFNDLLWHFSMGFSLVPSIRSASLVFNDAYGKSAKFFSSLMILLSPWSSDLSRQITLSGCIPSIYL